MEASEGPEARPDLGRDGGAQPVEKLLMLVGVFHFPTDYGIDVGELARELEAREFDSLFVCEHTHIPVSRRTPFPGGSRGQLSRARGLFGYSGVLQGGHDRATASPD